MAHELEKQLQIFDITLSHITDFAYIFDREGRFVYANRPLLELWGMSLDQVKGKNFFDLNYPPDLAIRLHKQIQGVIETKSTIRDETLYLSPTGVEGVYEYIFSPVFGQGGEVEVVAGSTRNITDRKMVQEELERRVRERTAELTATNNQLETVVYSIAHDLRAPLRSMQGFAQVLLDDYALNWGEEPQMYARRIIRAAETMDALTLGLLNYDRTFRSELKLEAVNLEFAWNVAIKQNEEQITRKQAQIETAAVLPKVLAHGATLAQVLSNLLDNSLKFSKPGARPQIRFWTTDKGPCIRIWIADEGIGIASEYHERIFRVFERLNGSSYEGMGIGLSLVRKGVERMQGKIGVESQLNEGARFWLEFPKIKSTAS